MNLSILEPRLENWARAQRSSGYAPAGAGSAEGMYRSGFRESCSDQDPLDLLDARVVNEAWKGLMPLDKDVLQLHYVWRAHSSFICRRLKLKQGRGNEHIWTFALYHAQEAIWKRLAKPSGVVNRETTPYNHRRLLIPA
ncbi:hypothetical protein [Burkholderia cenocepacia]|uniref:hypothetical protein n=1 Tax=Burkholderia cenocepacia TaxID=95486 RepID=UPI0028B714D5|nr:hypothetical protein [Burkholderia cenocepacia]MDT6993207.1 hypothetical protein [Burkholderia cenocepacia]